MLGFFKITGALLNDIRDGLKASIPELLFSTKHSKSPTFFPQLPLELKQLCLRQRSLN